MKMKDKIKEQIRMMQEKNINRVYIPNGAFRRLEVMIDKAIEETKKAERERILDLVNELASWTCECNCITFDNGKCRNCGKSPKYGELDVEEFKRKLEEKENG